MKFLYQPPVNPSLIFVAIYVMSCKSRNYYQQSAQPAVWQAGKWLLLAFGIIAWLRKSRHVRSPYLFSTLIYNKVAHRTRADKYVFAGLGPRRWSMGWVHQKRLSKNRWKRVVFVFTSQRRSVLSIGSWVSGVPEAWSTLPPDHFSRKWQDDLL